MRCHQQVTLNIEYPVFFKRDIFSVPVQDFWHEILEGERQSRAIFFIDENVDRCFPNLQTEVKTWAAESGHFENDVAVMTTPAGEESKNSFEVINELAQALTHHSICRHSYVFIIGGGATLDSVGFAASITHRGIRQIRIPTTVLAQDDSGVGVKNGINYFGYKNFLGTFYPPFAVVNDSSFLTTLEDRDWIAGIAEAFKVAIIKDKPFLDKLIELAPKIPQRDLSAMEDIVKPSAQIHLEHIKYGGDPFELGSARPLDFGHWSAHKLESLSKHGLRHGEAVAIGIGIDMFCAMQMDLVTEDEVNYVLDGMKQAGLPLWSDYLEQTDEKGQLEVIKGLVDFQEHIGGELTLTMPKGLGERVEINELPENIIHKAITMLKKRRNV